MRQIVILCGGIGSRIYPLTKHTPKAMLIIKGKPFLYYQLKLSVILFVQNHHQPLQLEWRFQ